MTLITACIICAENEEFIDLTMKSLIGVADQVVIVGDPNPATRRRIWEAAKLGGFDLTMVWREWDGLYGSARNRALEFAKGQWCLQIDADEVLSDSAFVLRDIARSPPKSPSGKPVVAFHMKYQHFIANFGLLDATVPEHVGHIRFYKKVPDVRYVRELHELATSAEFQDVAVINDPIIWHLGYLKGVAPVVQKYKMNKARSTVHSQEFLNQWRDGHLWGTYPVRPLTSTERETLPAILQKYVRGE